MALVAVVALLGGLLFRAGSAGFDLGMAVFAVVVVSLIASAVTSVVTTLSGYDPDAEAIATRLVDQPDQQLLLTRWLQRTRWARNVGGFAGLIWWVMATNGRGEILVLGLGGVAVGSMVAQLHQVRRPAGVRTASLERRSVNHYATSSTQRTLALIAAGSVIVLVVAVLGQYLVDDANAQPVRWAGGALLVVAVGVGLQYRVAGRPRPAVNSGLRQADDLARVLAIDRGLGQPAAFWAVAILADGVGGLEPVVGLVAPVLAFGLWVTALSMWWQNRRLGLDHLLDRSRQPPDDVAQPTSGSAVARSDAGSDPSAPS